MDGTFRRTGQHGSAFVFALNYKLDGPIWGAVIGGNGWTEGRGIVANADGTTTIAGETTASDFPTTPGAYQVTKKSGAGIRTGFVARLTPDGSGLVYSTFLGGSGRDRALGVALDSTGAAYVTGETTSSDFPTTSQAMQPTARGGVDAFVAKLNPTGSSLNYGTYLGGRADDGGYGIAVHGQSAYVTGYTYSPNFPTSNPAPQKSLAGGRDAFICRLAPDGTFGYGSYLGGSGDDCGYAVSVTATSIGLASVVGETSSANFPITSDAYQQPSGRRSAFVTRYRWNGATLSTSTVWNVGSVDLATGLATDTSGALYAGGLAWTDQMKATYKHGPCGLMDATLAKWRAGSATITTMVSQRAVPGTTVVLSGSVKAGGITAKNATVVFVVGGVEVGSAVTGQNGVATLSYVVPTQAEIGARLAWAFYAGTPAVVSTLQPEKPGYGSSTGRATLTVCRPTTLSVDSVKAGPGDQVRLRARLTSTWDKSPISGAALGWRLDGATLTGSPTTTDNSGYAELAYTVPSGISQSIHTITCTFDGMRDLMSCSGTAALTIAVRTSLSVPAVTGMAGGTVHLAATLKREDTSVVLAGRQVAFSRNGVALTGSPVTTDASGVASLDYRLPSDAVPGDHPVDVRYLGEAGLAPCGTTAAATITRTRLLVRLATPPPAATGSYIKISATITRSSDGAALSGIPVTCTAAGKAAGGFTTDTAGAGEFWYQVPAGAVTGAELMATVASTSRYEGAWSKVALDLQAGKASALVVDDTEGWHGETISVPIKLIDRWTASTGLPNAPLIISTPGAGDVMVRTDSRGYLDYRFVIPYDAELMAWIRLTITYRGNATYSACTGTVDILVSF